MKFLNFTVRTLIILLKASMDFAEPTYLICFGPLFWLALCIFPGQRKQAVINRLGAPQLIAKLRLRSIGRPPRQRFFLWFIALALVICLWLDPAGVPR